MIFKKLAFRGYHWHLGIFLEITIPPPQHWFSAGGASPIGTPLAHNSMAINMVIHEESA